MPDGITGIGTKFRRWNPDTSSWETISKITNISGPTMSRNTIDDTTFDNTDGYQSVITGLRDAGDVTLSMKFYRDGYETMKNDFESDDHKNYEIVLPDDDITTAEFRGYVTELPLEIPLDDTITADVTIKISGKVVINSGSFTSSVATESDFPT